MKAEPAPTARRETRGSDEGEGAAAEGHHPDFCVTGNRVKLELSTHAIGGLSENDFIMAAKINDLEGEGANNAKSDSS